MFVSGKKEPVGAQHLESFGWEGASFFAFPHDYWRHGHSSFSPAHNRHLAAAKAHCISCPDSFRPRPTC